ncbi:MAG: DUF721 domain-containing protein [Bacteroidales bacterium]|nr:DUF721 domain-containing protein [Bacteroidales bacterium]
MDRKKSATIGEVLERYLADSPLADGLRFSRVCQAWNDVVGPSVASMSSGQKFSAGVFTVRMGSSVLRMQLQMSVEDIRARMNKILGDGTVQKINLR